MKIDCANIRLEKYILIKPIYFPEDIYYSDDIYYLRFQIHCRRLKFSVVWILCLMMLNITVEKKAL